MILLCFAQPSRERGWGAGGGVGVPTAVIFTAIGKEGVRGIYLLPCFHCYKRGGGRGSSSVLLYVHRDHTDYWGGGGGGGGYLFLFL